MKPASICKGLLVLVVVLLLALPGISFAAEAPPDPASVEGSIVLQSGETLDASEVDHLQVLIRIYKENGMEREVDIVERMLTGKLSDWEVQQMREHQLTGFPGRIASDDHFVSSTHHLWTTVSRYWWMLGRNEHMRWSVSTATGGDWPIPYIEMTATAWDSAGVQAYNVTFGFHNASTVYCRRDDSPSSGRARSSVLYIYGTGPYDRYIGDPEGSY